MYPIGLSSCGKCLNESTFASYARAGITAIEISANPEELPSLPLIEIANHAQRYGIKLWSYHLPFTPFKEIDISQPHLADHTVSYFKELIRKATAIGIRRFVMHPSGEPIEDADRPIRMETAKRSLADLAEFTQELGAVIAVEDLPRTCLGNCASEIEELLSAHPALRVCFDTNHLLDEDPVNFIHRIGDRIITTHVSDYDFLNERHWLPGEGSLDWAGIVQALADVHYQGVWMYELGFGSTKTIERDPPLTCEDFANNAREIFQGLPLTKHGVPVLGLTSWKKPK